VPPSPRILHQHLASDDQGCCQEFLRAPNRFFHANLLVPHDLALVAVDRDDAPVRQVAIHEIVPQRDPRVRGSLP